MSASAAYYEFAPVRSTGAIGALFWAVLAHLLLLAALTWGVNWKHQASPSNTVQAELWSQVPQLAAPTPPIHAEPAPTPEPSPKIEPEPEKPPEIIAEKVKPAPKEPEPKPRKAPEEKKRPEAKAAQREQTLENDREAQREKEREKEREAQLKRMAALAGAGSADSPGSSAQSAGPSAGYGSLIKGRVRPHLVYTNSTGGNPNVSIELRLAPDGTILGRPRILRSSGNKDWDEAVVRAFEKAESLPRDNGRIHSPLVIDWRPND